MYAVRLLYTRLYTALYTKSEHRRPEPEPHVTGVLLSCLPQPLRPLQDVVSDFVVVLLVFVVVVLATLHLQPERLD